MKKARPLSAVTSPSLGVVCVITAATTVGYVGLLGQQGSLPGIDPRMWLVISFLTAIRDRERYRGVHPLR